MSYLAAQSAAGAQNALLKGFSAGVVTLLELPLYPSVIPLGFTLRVLGKRPKPTGLDLLTQASSRLSVRIQRTGQFLVALEHVRGCSFKICYQNCIGVTLLNQGVDHFILRNVIR